MTTAALTGDRWRHPVPTWDGREAGESSGHASSNPARPTHKGVDLMFPREPGEPATSPAGTDEWVMPRAWPALAAAAGVVKRVGYSKGVGWSVQIDHRPAGLPYATWYLHLERPLVRRGQRVRAGAPVGFIGGKPGGGLRHLHFELWDWRGPKHLDPAPYLAEWQRLNFRRPFPFPAFELNGEPSSTSPAPRSPPKSGLAEVLPVVAAMTLPPLAMWWIDRERRRAA